jgi:hypothetical protein
MRSLSGFAFRVHGRIKSPHTPLSLSGAETGKRGVGETESGKRKAESRKRPCESCSAKAPPSPPGTSKRSRHVTGGPEKASSPSIASRHVTPFEHSQVRGVANATGLGPVASAIILDEFAAFRPTKRSEPTAAHAARGPFAGGEYPRRRRTLPPLGVIATPSPSTARGAFFPRRRRSARFGGAS